MTDEELAKAVGFRSDGQIWLNPNNQQILELPDFNSLDVLAKWVCPKIIEKYKDTHVVYFSFGYVAGIQVWWLDIDIVPVEPPAKRDYESDGDDKDIGIACRKACEQVLVKE